MKLLGSRDDPMALGDVLSGWAKEREQKQLIEQQKLEKKKFNEVGMDILDGMEAISRNFSDPVKRQNKTMEMIGSLAEEYSLSSDDISKKIMPMITVYKNQYAQADKAKQDQTKFEWAGKDRESSLADKATARERQDVLWGEGREDRGLSLSDKATARERGKTMWDWKKQDRESSLSPKLQPMYKDGKKFVPKSAEEVSQAEQAGFSYLTPEQKLAREKFSFSKTEKTGGSKRDLPGLKYDEVQGRKDLLSYVGSKGFPQMVSDEGMLSFEVPVTPKNGKAMPDMNVIKQISNTGFDYTMGKQYKNEDGQWVSRINIGRFSGPPEGDTIVKLNAQGQPISTQPLKGAQGPQGPAKPNPAMFDIVDDSTARTEQEKLYTREELEDLSLIKGKDVYGLPTTRQPGWTIGGAIKDLASYGHDPKYPKVGEQKLEAAIRNFGISEKRPEINEIAKKLRLKYPKYSDNDIIKIIDQSLKQMR